MFLICHLTNSHTVYRKIKCFSLPDIKLAIGEESILSQLNEFGTIETRSMLVENAGGNRMQNFSLPTMETKFTIQVGGCGNKMGNLFWETLKNEHMMDDELRTESVSREDIDVYFREISNNRYIPRGIACDLDYSKVSPLLNTSNIFQTPGKTVKRDVFAKGFYTDGAELCRTSWGSEQWDGVLYDCIRKEVEVCDTFRGFQFHCNLGGGAGSGLTALLTGKLRDDYFSVKHRGYGLVVSFAEPLMHATVADIFVRSICHDLVGVGWYRNCRLVDAFQ